MRLLIRNVFFGGIGSSVSWALKKQLTSAYRACREHPGWRNESCAIWKSGYDAAVVVCHEFYGGPTPLTGLVASQLVSQSTDCFCRGYHQ